MGIQGLLPLLKSIMVPINVKELRGCSVAVDTYSWLHKAALSCSVELCKGLPTSRHIDYCMHRVNLLRHHGVEPVLIFDGGLLPMKIEQENKRARARKENLVRAIEHEANGNTTAAYECYQKAVDISPQIAYKLIQVLKQENVCYVVAPYEADAQMTFLAVTGQVDAVITEDSDLIPFGCPRIIFKMDKYGQGVDYQCSMLQRNKDISLTGFTKQMLLEMCILSGCDYLQSLPGMGLKRAHALIMKFKTYDKVIKHLRYSTVSVPPLYEETFKKAIWTFRHQRVYDPRSEDIIHLSDMSDDIGDELDFLGPLLPQHIAKGIAKGDLDPFTKLPFQDASAGVVFHETKLQKNFRPDAERKKLDLPVQSNLLTNYFCFASLDAKRKFKAPRNTENPSGGGGHYPSLEEQETDNIAACKTNCSPASLLECGNLDSGPFSEDSVEDGANSKVYESKSPCNGRSNDVKAMQDTTRKSLPQKYMPTIEKLSPVSRKEYEHRYASKAVGGKMRMEKRKIVVSPYFQHKVADDGAENTMEGPIAEDDAPNDLGDTVSNHYFIEKYQYTGRPMRKNTKIVVSSSFQHKVVDDGAENTMEGPIVEDDATTDLANAVPKDSFIEKYQYTGGPVKRKATTSDSIQLEKENIQCVQAIASGHNGSVSGDHCTLSTCDLSKELKAEVKFGSNISHLNRYSNIAEKSMKRFVSAISSFKHSSGARASGLRAPLKDVKNNCFNRPIVEVDFSKFAYIPNHRTTSASNRE